MLDDLCSGINRYLFMKDCFAEVTVCRNSDDSCDVICNGSMVFGGTEDAVCEYLEGVSHLFYQMVLSRADHRNGGC